MTTLLRESYFALFLILASGILLGRIRVRGVSLEGSAVIFVALLFGHYGVVIPSAFQQVGLILFIYTIGLQAGPGFFEAFRKHGRQMMLVTLVVIGVGTIATALLVRMLELDIRVGVGLLAGALTSTPGLAAAIESADSPLASIGYGVAYPIGVIGVILFLRVLPRLFRVNLPDVERQYEQEVREDFPALFSRNFVVENRNIDQKTIGELEIGTMTRANISRVMHEGNAVTPNRNTTLHLGDKLKAVGTRSALEKMRVLVGNETETEIPLSQGYEVQWLLVTNKKVVNRTLAQSNLLALYNATVTRIRRSGIDIAPNSHSRIRFGDKLMVACDRENMARVVKLLGNEDKRLSEADFFPFVTGIVLGVLLGAVKLPVGAMSFSLGISGGVLVTAILLGRMGRTGPIMWTMSGSANQLLRELGLLLFLAAVGTEAGTHLVATVKESGWSLLLAAVTITLLPMVAGAVVAYYFLRIGFLSLLGVLAGSMTSTPGLAAATPLTQSNAPAVAYATVYPFALVLMIVACHVLGRL